MVLPTTATRWVSVTISTELLLLDGYSTELLLLLLDGIGTTSSTSLLLLDGLGIASYNELLLDGFGSTELLLLLLDGLVLLQLLTAVDGWY